MSDVIADLEADHRRVEELFKSYRRTTDDQRPEVLQDLVRELSVHAALEEQIIYPAVRAKLDQGTEEADHAIDEHQEVKELLTTLEKDDGQAAERVTVLARLMAEVRSHVEEEENDLLPKLRAAVGPDELRQLGEAMAQAKKLAPTRPHPHAPSTPPGNVVAGPAAALVDKARDAVEGR